MSFMCADCNHLGCKKGDLTKTMACCPSKDEEIQAKAKELYQEPENYNIAHTAAKLAVKDRVTGHNPLAAIYMASGYYRKRFYPENK